MSEYIQIGVITTTHGFEGKLVVQSKCSLSDTIETIPLFFVERNKNSFIPYFITDLSLQTKDRFTVKVESIDSKEEAKELLKKNIFLKQETFDSVISSENPAQFIGYTLWDKKEKALGPVLEIIEYPQQILAKISYKNREMLIPLNEETIRKVKKKKKIIYVALPDGLIDIY